jgi:sigma-B regulation protein RsbU (phosphoserine phosphatase)
MAFKVALLLAFAAQVIAAVLALRINFRYRIYSAWFFVSAAASVGAILRLTMLVETWSNSPPIHDGGSLWSTVLASLLASVLLMAAMGLIEPFFQHVARAEEALRHEHREMSSFVSNTEDDLRVAQRIQQLLLPTEAPQIARLDIHGEADPAEWTSGDYFDYLTLADGETAFVIADVSGHGLGPALLMSSTRASFRALAPTVTEVGELLTLGNRAVADAVAGRGFVTAFAVKFDRERESITYAAAGHTAYLLKASGCSQVLEADSPPLGVVPEVTVATCQQAGIEPGDTLILVTDGILEARNASDDVFGERRLLATVSSHPERSAQETVAALLIAAKEFTGDRPLQDDITAVIVRVAGQNGKFPSDNDK